MAIDYKLLKVDHLDELLTAEEREQLQKDLSEMARLRRLAEAKSAQIVLP